MIELYLWSFDKKRNSTKQPTDAGTRFDGELKQSFTLTGLEVTLNLGKFLVAPSYNYAYIPSLSRYYFITNWVYTEGLWTAVLAVDVLATYKTEIGNSQEYITRAYSDYNPNIIDMTYPTVPDKITRANAAISPANFWGADVTGTQGTIVAGIVGKNAGAVGAVTYYAMSFSTFGAFMSTMLTDVTWAGVTEITQDLLKTLVNPTQYIVSCRWFPIQFSGLQVGTATTTINLGWWTFNLSGTARILSTVGSAWVTRSNTLTIPKHPNRSGRNAYLECAPYSDYVLKFFPFGVFQIDSTDLYDMTYLCLDVDFSLMTGDGVLRVGAKKVTGTYDIQNAFLVVQGQVGVTLPIGAVSFDTSKVIQAINTGKSAFNTIKGMVT